MTLIRLSDIDNDRQVLVNLDQIVQVDARHGPRGLQQRALRLTVVLSDGSRLACFPVDEYGGFDSTTDDESVAIHNFQLAAQHLRADPEAEQGVSS
ncbi:hypothetical protein CIK66_10490 [Brachybacterium alimentarium]|uniref:Uncharacterized protein n=1 Tax=Brachybacterium alimentarium TaxID=47845 RepID=A0A2A3YII8_9MICO|nr:hypothetical protein [Brachybacterium alimentarium]PCC39107.1 hypothetical protein CIK66_10490 [Brachybacterium alimentarium]